jgi:hypothetical protein
MLTAANEGSNELYRQRQADCVSLLEYLSNLEKPSLRPSAPKAPGF